MKTRKIFSAVFIVVLTLFITDTVFASDEGDVQPQSPPVTLTHGPLVGDVRPDHVQIWIRTGYPSNVAVSYGTPSGKRTTTPPVTTGSASDYTASLMVSGLRPGTAYEYQVLVDGHTSNVYKFTTAPLDGDPGEFSVAVLSDSFGYNPAPGFASVAGLVPAPAGFMIIGDHDHSDPGGGRLGDDALDAMRALHRRLRDGSTRLGADFASAIIPAGLPLILRQEDDHDSVGNDSSMIAKVWPQVIQAWREYYPMLADNGLPTGMWQRTQRGRVAFVSLDLRSNRNLAWGQKHTTLGDAQKAWLESVFYQLAKDPTVTWVVLVSTAPFNPAQTKQDSWSGYAEDREWLLDRISAAGLQNVLILSGDCHWGSIDDGTHSIIPELNVPQLNVGFSNTCSNRPAQWTLNQDHARPGFGFVTFRPDGATLAIYDAEEGTLQLSLTVPAKNHPPSCVRTNPTVSISPAQSQPIQAGAVVTYAVSVTNKDTSGCSASSFALQATVPNAWTSSLGNTALSLSPGASTTTTLKVTSPASATLGSYSLILKATNSQATTFSASASARYVIGGGSNTFADKFDRADSTTLGNGWVEAKGDLVIISNEVKNLLTGVNVATLSAFTGPTQTVAADFASVDNNGSPRYGVILRYQDPQNYYVLYRQTGGTSWLCISKVVNGLEKVLKYIALPNPTQNTFFRLEGRASGTTLKLLFNGVEQLSVSDTTFATGTVGILMGSRAAKSCRADNFSATAQ